MKTSWIMLLAPALWLTSAALPATEPAAPAPSPEVVIVPYDPAKPAAQQRPDRLYLPYERFNALWEKAKAHRAGDQPEKAKAPSVLSSARYEGTLGERAITFTGQLDLTTNDDSWVEVPFAFQDAKISAIRIDGIAAAYDGEKIVVERPGRHAVEIAFEIPFTKGAQSLSWGVPRTAATVVSLALPDERTRVTIAPGSGVVEVVEQGRKRVTAAIGTTDRIRLEWKTSAIAARAAESAVAAITTHIISRVGREEIDAELVYQFTGARQDRFTVYLDNSLLLTRIGAASLKSWRLIGENGARQALEIELTQPVDESFTLRVGAERPLPALPADLKTPVIGAAARRIENAALIFQAEEGIEVSAQPAPGQRQIPWERRDGGEGGMIVAYAGAGEPAYRLALREARREARVDYVYQVNRRKIELIASLELHAKGDELRSAVLGLPSLFEIQAIESERLQDWWREGDTLHLRFQGSTPDVTPLVVYLVRQYPTAPTELEIRPLTLQGFRTIEGEAVIAAHKGVDAALKLSAEAREIAPETAASAFHVLPPLERKRAFSFKNQAFSGQVALAAVTPKTNALWVMHAQAHEGWLSLSVHARLTMRQGSMDRATFSLPADAPEARVSGAEALETRSSVVGDRRLYEVQFRNDVYGAVEFTADLEVPNPGEAPLPSIAFPDAQMASGFVLTDNASEFEIKVQTSGVDPAPASEVPFLPSLSKSAGIFRVQPNWQVAIGVERLEKAATRSAFVAWAELTTALRVDGAVWHRATYRLQNRSLQFLPVKMPAGAQLVSVRVAGRNVRADTGKVGGTPAVLVPLIKTKPGDLSYNVELVYRQIEPALGWWSQRDLDDPELLGITVERTFWNVWLPADRKLQRASGNMEPVLAEVNKAEKLEGSLLELKSLVTLARSSEASYESKKAALGNIQRLKKEIESENRDENFSESDRLTQRNNKEPSPTPTEETVGKQGLLKQGEYVSNKRREISAQLDQEVQKLGDVTIPNPEENIPGAPPAGMSNSNAPQSKPQAPTAERWSKNNAYTVPGKIDAAPAPLAPPSEAGNNVYFNDNIILQRGPESKYKDQAANNKAPVPAKTASKFASILGWSVASSKGEKAPAPAAESEVGKQQQLQGFYSNRGNTVRSQEEVAAMRPSPAPATPMAPEATGVPLLPPARDDVPPLPSSSRTAPTNAWGMDFGGPQPAGPPPGQAAPLSPRLDAAGRSSLAVDFPTEGQLFHFKKIKANAELDLTLVAPEAFDRWQALALAIGLAALLSWFGRWRRRRAANSNPTSPAATPAA